MNILKIHYFYLGISLSGLALEIDELVYLDEAIPKQIEHYAECYENAYKGIDPDSMNDHHVEGLFGILGGGLFPYLRDHILYNDITKKDKTIADKDLYIGYLNQLYKAAIAIEKDKNLNMINFARINVLATLIAQIYSNYPYNPNRENIYDLETIWNDTEHYNNNTTIGFKRFLEQDTITEYITTELNKKMYADAFKKILPQKGYYAMVIIYSHKPIGYKTFIDALFKYEVPLLLGQVIASKLPQSYEDYINEKPTKKEVHYGSLKNAPYQFLIHDIFHVSLYKRTNDNSGVFYYDEDDNIKTNITNSITNLLRPIYLNNDNNRLKFAGLFYLLHEHVIGTNYNYHVDNSSIIKLLEFDIYDIKRNIPGIINSRKKESYKISFRDNEYILYYANYMPLITISDNNKKLLPLAQDGQNTIALHKFTEDNKKIEAINIDDGSILYIDYSYDEDNNLKLAEPWQLITTQTRKNLKDISDKRQLYMEKVLSNAFIKFWDDFLELAKKSLK